MRPTVIIAIVLAVGAAACGSPPPIADAADDVADTYLHGAYDELAHATSGLASSVDALCGGGTIAVAEDFERIGVTDVEVRADSFLAFNGRRSERFVDPAVDLLGPAPDEGWVLAPPGG